MPYKILTFLPVTFFGLSIKDSTFYLVSIYVGWCVLRLLLWIYSAFIRNRKNFKQEYGNNSWALVTGATDGIGKAFCEELAKDGFNILLVSRTEEKLMRVATEIRKINPEVKVSIVTFNFSNKTTVEDYEEDFKNILDYDISILVNNVGVSMKDKLQNLTLEEAKNYVDMNVTPQTFMTRLLINKMLKREKRSAVINLSSTASLFASPNRMSLYGSTKLFNDYLSKSLGKKYNNKIDFLTIKPLMVESSQTKYVPNNITVITATQSASGSLNALGYETETYGHWKHQIQGFLLTCIPEYIFVNLIGVVVSIMKKNKAE